MPDVHSALMVVMLSTWRVIWLSPWFSTNCIFTVCWLWRYETCDSHHCRRAVMQALQQLAAQICSFRCREINDLFHILRKVLQHCFVFLDKMLLINIATFLSMWSYSSFWHSCINQNLYEKKPHQSFALLSFTWAVWCVWGSSPTVAELVM